MQNAVNNIIRTAPIWKAACAYPAALSISPAPSAWADFTWLPMRGTVEKAKEIHRYIPAAPTAATASADNLPIQIISIKLYAI